VIHNATIKRVRVPHLGTRYKLLCRCGIATPLLTKDAAESARAKHLWECGQEPPGGDAA
jgi:hypothetical protein